jgi:energy coupling factor transporter S component ThiW
MNTKNVTKKLVYAGILVAVAVVGSLFNVPVAGSKCAPVQHMVNIISAVFLGPFWGVGIAFCASLLRNLFGIGSLMAFPGSMVGALCCGMVYKLCRNIAPTCIAEAFGTGILGGLCAYPVAKILMGLEPAGFYVFITPFLISTVAGSILAYLLVSILKANGVLDQVQHSIN